MTDNEIKVLQLNAALQDIDDNFLCDKAREMIWDDWDLNCWHSDSIRIGQAVDEYQVIRYFDVEGERKYTSVDVEDPLSWPYWVDEERVQEAEYFGSIEEDEGKTLAYVWLDDMQPYGEFARVFVNVNSGEVVILERESMGDPIAFNYEGGWGITSKEEFWGVMGMKTRHFDFSVHPKLFMLGYDPMEIEPYEDLNYCDDYLGTFYKMDGMVYQYISNLIKGCAYDELCKQGITRPKFVNDERKNIYRICRKHGYAVTDAEMYNEYIEELVHLGRDTHNPHYICPDNLDEAYDRIVARARREAAARQERETLRKIYEDEHAEEIFAKLRGPYLGIAFSNDQYDVHVLQSVKEYVEEGQRMHHCVGKMGYWKKMSSICVSIRDKEGERYATAEISLDDFKVLQLYGICDRVLNNDLQVRTFLLDNVWRFKEATRKTSEVA